MGWKPLEDFRRAASRFDLHFIIITLAVWREWIVRGLMWKQATIRASSVVQLRVDNGLDQGAGGRNDGLLMAGIQGLRKQEESFH